jgi:small subunit ribosomal protein S18
MADQENLIVDDNDDSGSGGPSGAPAERGGRGGPRRKTYNQRLNKTSIELYKDVELLRRFLSERGKIRPRRQTGLCARDQRRLAVAVKRARHLALLPFDSEMGRSND